MSSSLVLASEMMVVEAVMFPVMDKMLEVGDEM